MKSKKLLVMYDEFAHFKLKYADEAHLLRSKNATIGLKHSRAILD